MKTSLLFIVMALFTLTAMPQHHRKTTHGHHKRTAVHHTGKARKAQSSAPAQSAAPAAQEGIASFYAKVVKSKMANGQRYHKDSMICAHRTHPFGTLLKVTNLRNNKIVVVKVTDRGPFSRGRIIDLSYGAAEKLGFISSGLTKVRVEVYDGHLNSEIDTHPTDSTDLLIDYNNREQYEFPYTPTEKKTEE